MSENGIRTGFLFLALALFLTAQERHEATVRFEVVDLFGNDLPYKVDQFLSDRGNADIAARFVGLRCRNVPFGVYRFRLVRSDLRGEAGWLTGEMNVETDEIFKVLLGDAITAKVSGRAAAVSIRPQIDFSIVGTIKPAPTVEPMWVRLKGMFQNFQVDLTVGPDGTFRIGDPLEGSFVLLVLRRSEIVGVQPVVFRQGRKSSRFTVNLKDIGVNTIIVDGSDDKR